MPTFLIGIDGPKISRDAVWTALTESNLAGLGKLCVLEFSAPRMLYPSIHEVHRRAEDIVDAVLRQRTDGLVCIGVASGVVPWKNRGNMPPLRYDCAVAVHVNGRRSPCRHLNPIPIFLPHPDGEPNMPLETIFGLKRFVREECKALRHRDKALRSP